MPVELLVLICLVVGIFPAVAVGDILLAAATPVVGGVLPEFSLAIWHGINTPLIMSVIALLGGIALFGSLHWLRSRAVLGQRTPVLHRFSGKRAFENLLARLSWLARAWRRATRRC